MITLPRPAPLTLSALPFGLALVAVLGSGQALACYTVYDAADRVIYHAAAAPVDMRYPLHQTVPAIFPGGHLIFSLSDTDCPRVNHTPTGFDQQALKAAGGRPGHATHLGPSRVEMPVLPARP